MTRLILALLLTSCAHAPVPPGEPCPPWEAGWLESRGECEVWRCNAVTLRCERLEVCG